MFRIVISQPNLAAIVTAVTGLVNEAVVQISEKDIRIEAVDPANVAMVFLTAGQAAFDFYLATAGKIAMDFGRLAELAGGKEPVSIELDEDNHKLRIAQGKAKYSMSLLDPGAVKGNPRLPQMDMPCSITMVGADLSEAIKNAGKVSDHVIMGQHEEDFSISAKGDVDSFSMKFPLSELTGIRQGESRALFSLDYLEDMAKVSKGVDVTIETGIDYPAKISCKPVAGIDVMYLLAPRIEQE
jgi:proliferating cell nuclear antigen